jgi:DNA-binding transcriptional ArsR family regulator
VSQTVRSGGSPRGGSPPSESPPGGSPPGGSPPGGSPPGGSPPGGAARFDEQIHAPTRLAIIALLAATEWADFSFIRDEVGLSDSALSKQLTALEGIGYVQIRKGFVGKRPRTSASLTRAGRTAFHGHVAALQQIVERSGASVIPR